MWKGSEDPAGPSEGGTSGSLPQSNQQLEEMKDQFDQQQMLITQLKEIMKKTDQSATTVTQEKVAEYANTLTKMKSRAKRHTIAKEKGGGTEVTKPSTPASEKVLLLKQQLEQNKAKLAERGKSQKGIEEMVAQVKAQLDDSQHQINLSQTPLNISIIEDRVDYTPHLSSQELYNILLNKDKRINEMNTKISKLQANVMDLQENVKEKDSVIDARTKAITLMSENLSKKGKTTLDALEDTKEQMRRMQENFIETEENLKAENSRLNAKLGDKLVEIQRMQAENNELFLQNSELKKNEQVLQAKITELEKSKTSRTNSPSKRSPSKTRKGKKGKVPSNADTSNAEEDNNVMLVDLEKQVADKLEELNTKSEEMQVLKKHYEDAIAEYQETIKGLQDKIASQTDELEKVTGELSVSIQRESAVKFAKVETIIHDNETDDAEINKLKQQLDEANKNMIKVKAQHKSKLKDLTKKIDAFKMISDVNAELVKAENENTKLQMKIVELEEEKGQLQLGMVESKESINVDALEATIKELTSKLGDHETTINNYVSENTKYQEELNVLREKLDQLTSAGVKQELTTVQFEEQYESLEKEKSALQTTIETLEQQIVDLNGQMEALKKERADIQVKYDGLLQENAELIDRLEKLSTEKVSSAESIEIVENFTQQEKLELEAYQKSLLPKTSCENLEDNADLNDSVNQLTEETSELLQKIELFTVERREVMEKLELLTEENNQLSLKLREVENNRDVLVETYEQLQTEKEVLDTKLEECEIKIAELTKNADTVDHSEVAEYKNFVQMQKDEINDLQLKLLSYEKHDKAANSETKWQEKCMKLIARTEDLQAQLVEIKEANQNYDDIIEENKQELIKYAQLLDANNTLIEKYEQLKLALDKHQQAGIERDARLNQSEAEIRNLTDSVDEYEKELNEKCKVIKNFEIQIHALQEEKVMIETNLAEKSGVIESLHLEKHEKEVENEKLLKQAENSSSAGQRELEIKMQELQSKNKEQLEKMKKLAANLKKKTLDYKELEAKYNELTVLKENTAIQQSLIQDLGESEKLISLETELASTVNELENLKSDYSAKNNEVSKLIEEERLLQQENNQIKTRNEEITAQLHTYSGQIEDLQNIIHENEFQLNAYNREMDAIRSSGANEEKEDVIRRLNEEIEALKYNSQSSNNALQMKIHEQEMCIETQEQELVKYKEKCFKLEESLSEVEVCRQSLEQKAIDLGNKLENNKSSFIEAAEKEQHLESRLQAFAEKDQRIEEKLVEVQEENRALHTDNQKLLSEVNNYKQQINNYNLRIKEYEENQEIINGLESIKQELELKCKNLENEIKKLQLDLMTLQTETDKNDNELQQQLEKYAVERKQLMEQLEIAHEECNMLVETRKELQATVEDLNSKLDQQQVEFEETINKYHDLQREHKKVLTNTEELENINKILEERIQELIKEEAETPEYLEQLLNQRIYELQEFKQNYIPSPSDFFNENVTEVNLNKEILDLRLKLSHKGSSSGTKVQEMEQELKQRIESLEMNEALLKKLQEELSQKDARLKEVESELIESKTQLDFARNMLEQVEADNFQTLNRNSELEQQIQSLEAEKMILEEKASTQHQPQGQTRLQWPETVDDPFAFVQSQHPVGEEVMAKTDARLVEASIDEASRSGNTEEELLQKIKTLEFMVYNAEQEKESAQVQCAQLSEELGRFIYEREKRQTESAIVHNESQFNIESQIVSGEEFLIPPQIPFEPSKELAECTSSQNVAEEACSQKHAYECHPSAFADDDGWGFDVQETKMEESHASASSPTKDGMVAELREKIRLLNLEREAHLEEINQANIKSGKLLKKLKEFKVRNDQLVAKMKAKSSDDFGLEDAIQEELKMQIANLEKKLKDTDAELGKERNERENLAKRVDVLTSANERLIEMKEKQDIEVMGYQQQTRDLQLKLEKVAWSSDFSEQVVSTSSNTSVSVTSLPIDNTEKQLQELRDSIKELTLDNDELQAMLEEQTRLRKEAEGRAKSISSEAEQGQLQALLDDKAGLLSEIAKYKLDKENLQVELESVRGNLSSICGERDDVQIELKKLNEKLQENYKEKTYLEATLLENGILIESLKKTIDETQASMDRAEALKTNEQADVDNAKLELEHLRNEKEIEINGIKAELLSLQGTIEIISTEKQELLDMNSFLECSFNDMRNELQRNNTELVNLKATSTQCDALLNEISALKEEVKEISLLKQQLSAQRSEYEEKLLTSSEQLALEWAQHVEQRGNDVAESWKLHVETRENEFTQSEQSLRRELNEVEEKCNALVNENNELRRNVDAEIRNEVDRVSALQQQIADRQAHVAKLAEALQLKGAELERLREENASLIKQLHEYEGRINTSSEELTTLLQRQDEKDKAIAELSARLQCSSDNKVSEELIQALQAKLSEKDNEITKCKNTIDELMADKAQMAKMKSEVEANQLQLAELSKDNERNERLKQKLEESTLQVTTLQGTLQEKEHRLRELEAFVQQQQNEDSSSKMQLQTHVQELQQQIAQYVMQLRENNLHIGSLDEEIESYKVLSNHLQTKETEIQRLNALLDEKSREHEYALENQLLESQSVLSTKIQEYDTLRRLLNQTEIARDDMMLVKNSEVDAYRQQLESVNKQLGEYQVEYMAVQNKLSETTAHIATYEQQIVTQQVQFAEYERQMAELNAIIEGQVLKIEELQQDIYEKSRNYDALVAQMDDTRELQKKVRFAESGTASSSDTSSELIHKEEDPLDAIRAELDLALYMLHQRDVRCEELTVELMQLLEERDTLQLRLSNALRVNETIRASGVNVAERPPTEGLASSSGDSVTSTIGEEKRVGASVSGSQEGVAVGGLANKLTELKVVGYKKDKTLVDEQELRRLQQMAFLQQHKDDVSKLPAEAQARLRDANYTLSRDVQSPSKVLLNWLWGTSTPKVNHA